MYQAIIAYVASPHRCRIAHGCIAMEANCLHLKLFKKSTPQLHHTIKAKFEHCGSRAGMGSDVTCKRKGALDLLKNKSPIFPIHQHHHSADITGGAEKNKHMLLFPLQLAVWSLTNTAFSDDTTPPHP